MDSTTLRIRTARAAWAAAAAALYFTMALGCALLLGAGMMPQSIEPAASLFMTPAAIFQGAAGMLIRPLGWSEGEAVILPKPAAALACCLVAIACCALAAFLLPAAARGKRSVKHIPLGSD